MRIKKGLKDLNPTNLSFPEDTKIYVNDSLCPYYRGLWNECKKLWNNKRFIRTLLLKLRLGSNRLEMVHIMMCVMLHTHQRFEGSVS